MNHVDMELPGFGRDADTGLRHAVIKISVHR